MVAPPLCSVPSSRSSQDSARPDLQRPRWGYDLGGEVPQEGFGSIGTYRDYGLLVMSK